MLVQLGILLQAVQEEEIFLLLGEAFGLLLLLLVKQGLLEIQVTLVRQALLAILAQQARQALRVVLVQRVSKPIIFLTVAHPRQTISMGPHLTAAAQESLEILALLAHTTVQILCYSYGTELRQIEFQ